MSLILDGDGSISGLNTITDIGNINIDQANITGIATFGSDVQISDVIEHNGDSNTRIRFPAADTFTVETAGSERVRVSSAGSFCIGTNIPRARFQVVDAGTGIGNVAVFGNQNINHALQIQTSDGNLEWGFNALNSRHLFFSTNQQERIRITSTGDVGIGTDNPTGTGAVTGNTAVLAVGVATVNTLHATNIVSPANGYRNMAINGDMTICQRTWTDPWTITNLSASEYRCDQHHNFMSVGNPATVGAAQTTDVPAGTDFKFSNRLRIVSGGAQLADDFIGNGQYIEGTTTAKLRWGTADAKDVTVSWYVKAPQGVYSCVIRNSNDSFINDLHYLQEYTITAANNNVWHKQTLTFPGPTTGTWQTNVNSGMQVLLMHDVGSDWNTTADAWLAGNFFATTNMTNTFADTTGNEYLYTGFQVEEGDTATEFEFLPYTVNDNMCKRYYYRKHFNARYRAYGSEITEFPFEHPVTMRVTPTAGAVTADTTQTQQTNNNAAQNIFRLNRYCGAAFLQASVSSDCYVLGYYFPMSAVLP